MGGMAMSDAAVCATCEIDVPWRPVRRDGRSYCCEGCAAGGPCSCSYDQPVERDGDGAAVATGGARHPRRMRDAGQARRPRVRPSPFEAM
jgi:hypothetical protein